MKSKSFLFQPTSSYYLLLVSTAALTGLGLVMVLSASSIHSLETSGSSFSIFFRQLIFLIIAIPTGLLSARLPIRTWKIIARFSFLGSVLMLLLLQIPGMGNAVNGNRNWIAFGPVVFQPSEFAKFFMILWAGSMLAKQEEAKNSKANVIAVLVPTFFAVMLLVMLGNDLGNAVIFAAILVALLFVSGIQLRLIGVTGLLGLSMVAALIITVPNRMRRLLVVLHPFSPEYYKLSGWQPAHSIMGLASGGFFGVGLGASRQKWGNLAEAHTDFIFSVIGEELGLVGTLVVLALFATLILAIFRIAIRAKDPLVRFASAGIGCWIAVQVVLNIGSATSLLPVVGVTLPLLSYGGSSLIATYLALGFVIGAALRDPALSPKLARRKVRG
ncbi:MAG: putative lipid II flippase FtsW [Candidatus Nanopelagicaceae bacterium]|nr:putative lipid II flippase FtsW [Candidatus Nanopelagicaceae bacterium]